MIVCCVAMSGRLLQADQQLEYPAVDRIGQRFKLIGCLGGRHHASHITIVAAIDVFVNDGSQLTPP